MIDGPGFQGWALSGEADKSAMGCSPTVPVSSPCCAVPVPVEVLLAGDVRDFIDY
jgi:hypothetical protein